MAPDIAIIDTDILIDFGRSRESAASYIENLDAEMELAISAVTVMELIVGCQNRTALIQLMKSLGRYRIIKLNETISDITCDLLREYRLSHGLLIEDAMIAATAMSLDCPLASKNQRHFRFISGLDILPYP